MTSLIDELQRDALSQNTSTSELLRKALIVASKLKVKEFSTWVDLELKGYDKNTEIPSYRILHGKVKAQNPYRGWIPVMVQSNEHMKLLSQHETRQSVSEIESLIQAQKEQSDGIIAVETPRYLLASIKWDHDISEYPISLHLGTPQLYSVLESVRTAILEWALKLEEDGIKGEGMSFSSEEREIASSKTYHVNNYIERMDKSQIQQDTTNSSQIMHNHDIDLSAVGGFIKELRESLGDLNLAPNDQATVESDVATIEIQLKSPTPKESTIKECIISTRTILEATAAGLLTTGLVNHGDKIPFLLESIHRLILHP